MKKRAIARRALAAIAAGGVAFASTLFGFFPAESIAWCVDAPRAAQCALSDAGRCEGWIFRRIRWSGSYQAATLRRCLAACATEYLPAGPPDEGRISPDWADGGDRCADECYRRW